MGALCEVSHARHSSSTDSIVLRVGNCLSGANEVAAAQCRHPSQWRHRVGRRSARTRIATEHHVRVDHQPHGRQSLGLAIPASCLARVDEGDRVTSLRMLFFGHEQPN